MIHATSTNLVRMDCPNLHRTTPFLSRHGIDRSNNGTLHHIWLNMKQQPDFGTPTDDFERAAYDWLMVNVGLEGESIMQSLADVMREFAIRRLMRTPAPWESGANG